MSPFGLHKGEANEADERLQIMECRTKEGRCSAQPWSVLQSLLVFCRSVEAVEVNGETR